MCASISESNGGTQDRHLTGKVSNIGCGSGRRRSGRCRLPIRLGTDRGGLDSPDRRLRPGRRDGTRSLYGRSGPVAGRRCPGVSAGLDHPDGPPQSHRPPPAPRAVVRGAGVARAVMVQPDRRGARLRHERDPRRSASSDFHLLPPGHCPRRAGRLDASDAWRPRDRRNCAGVSRAAGDDGAAAGARETKDSRRRHSVRRPRYERHAAAARRGPDGDLSGLQRRIRADSRCAARQNRSFGGGDPAGAPCENADDAAPSRSDSATGPDAVARFAARCPFKRRR